MVDRHVVSVILAPAVGLLVWHTTACAQSSVLPASGNSSGGNSDMQLVEPGTGTGTGFTIRPQGRELDPFGAAPYYGFRVSRFFETHPGWGLAFDFAHYKVLAETERVALISEPWNGMTGKSRTSINGTPQNFETSPGMNVVSLSGIYRWSNPAFFEGRLQPYVQAGVSYSLPYRGGGADPVLNQMFGDASGFGLHLQGGVQYRLSQQWGLFAGAKFDTGSGRMDAAGNPTDSSLRTLHVMGGASFHF